MKTLYLECSTGSCRNGSWVEELDTDGVERIVVGTGPGSFAGIRSALAFAQGYALGSKCEVLGLPSACASAATAWRRLSAEALPLAVVGDARQGKIWIALFRDWRLERDVFQIAADGLKPAVGEEYLIVTPDDMRIGELLKAVFGERYRGGEKPTAAGLETFAEHTPSILRPEPLPLYLNPAVRKDI